MKKFYIMLAALSVTASMAAQQLPNAGFEDDWAACSPYTGGETTTSGTTPAAWTIANVAGYKIKVLGWMGKTTVGDKTEGYESASAVLLKNSPNSVVKAQTVPGYITLGTTWNTANTSGAEKDGGSFGGIDFAYRPDAILFDYKRTLAEGSNEQATVIAYTWTGSTSQADVPVSIGSRPTITTMVNRDRNILDMETAKGGDVTKSDDFELVSKINYAIQEAQDTWKSLEIPFEYLSDKTPEKINVIFGAGNYFSTEPEQGNELTVDNVKLVYYSRLSGLQFKDIDIAGFDPDKFDYELDEVMPDDDTDIKATTLGNSGVSEAAIELDHQNSLAKITVTNAHGNDADDQNSHVYTVKFLPAGSSINDVIDMTSADVRYVDLYGNAVAADALVNGQTYIKLVNGKATKVIANN